MASRTASDSDSTAWRCPSETPIWKPFRRYRKNPSRSHGDLYALGPHRLLCGDATNADDLKRVMGGELASCMWTDPPYGVSYQGGTRDKLTLKNDDAEGLYVLLAAAFAAAGPVLTDGAAIRIAYPPGALSVIFGQRFLAQGWRLHQTLVWEKDSLVVGHTV